MFHGNVDRLNLLCSVPNFHVEIFDSCMTEMRSVARPMLKNQNKSYAETGALTFSIMRGILSDSTTLQASA